MLRAAILAAACAAVVTAHAQQRPIAAEAVRSGITYAGADIRAMQADDLANPGFLWVQRGEALFNENCSLCHGERGHATTLLGKRLGPENAVLESRTNLNADLVRHVVRHGINSMPWFRRAELSERELESIISYLTRSS